LSSSALSHLICPIGLPALYGKDPAVIAASVAADLLIRRQAMQTHLDHGSIERQEKRLAMI
jgi:xanthine dehydrogenase accessory factor